jgi:hypothetical protein
MTKLNVNIGLSVNDKTGDTLRSAFDKINQNFTELYTLTGGSSSALTELAQDYAAPMFNHASHVNITAVYDDANNKILLTGASQVQSDWTQTTNTALDFIKNKPTLFSGSYTDLTNKPTIPAGIGDFTFTNSSATVPVNTTLTLTAFDNTTKESKLTLSPTTKSSLYAANNLELGIGYGTGFEKYWLFGSDGSIRFPDTTVQTTAWPGSVSSLVNGAKTISLGTDGILTLPADAVVKTISGNLTIEGQNYVIIDSATNGQIEIGRSSGVGAVILGNKSLGTNSIIDSDLFVKNGVYERFSSLADATGIVTHNCANGHIFYHTSPDALFTVNFTNLNLPIDYATSLTLIIAQGGTGFIPNSVGISGVLQTINWQGNVTPTPSTNRTDVVTFSIICTALNTYTVLGQLTGF